MNDPIKKLQSLLLFCLLTCSVIAQNIEHHQLATPSDVQLKWQNNELTMFVHFGPATWQDHEYDDLSTPLERINPKQLSTDQWAQVAKSYGATMIIFVAKHTGGFCWWQTNTTKYSIKNTPWKNGNGDVMKDLSVSCKKYGVGLGIYLSPEDRYLNVGMGGKARDTTFQQQYEKIYREQLTELLTRYGDIKEVWVDGSLVFTINGIIKKLAAHAVVLQSSAATIRWVGNEMGYAPYPAWNAVSDADAKSGNSTASHGNPNGDTWLPIEVDVSLRRPNWFWKTNNENDILSLKELMKLYYLSVGRGCVLLINTSPDTTGLIPEKDAARLKGFGEEIKRRFGHPIATISGSGTTLLLPLSKEENIDHLLLMENIQFGERIRSFVTEVYTQNKWTPVFTGSSIGHKLIIQFPEVKTSVVRLRILSSAGVPKIKTFSAFYNQSPLVEIPAIKDTWKIRNIGEWDLNKVDSGEKQIQLNISPYCKEAQAYEVAFVIKSDKVKEAQFSYDWAQTGLWTDNIEKQNRLFIISKHLLFDGVNADQYLLKDEKFPDRIHFNLTGIAPNLLINVKLKIPGQFNKGKVLAYILRK
ncbi:MAG: alpha-L-fucosidase [Bacteroidota bacterium]|nr:alpha-L-fucosidase [Bacteroidota bacterium]